MLSPTTLPDMLSPTTLPDMLSPTTFSHPPPGIADEYGAPGMGFLNPSPHVTELKPVSVLFGHWETKAVRELVLAKLSSTEMEEYDLRAWESSESNVSGAADFNWAPPRIVEKVDNWLSTVVDIPQVVNNSSWSSGSE